MGSGECSGEQQCVSEVQVEEEEEEEECAFAGGHRVEEAENVEVFGSEH